MKKYVDGKRPAMGPSAASSFLVGTLYGCRAGRRRRGRRPQSPEVYRRGHYALSLLVAVVLALCRVCGAQQAVPALQKPVKVFLLLGQSNMLGMGDVGPETTKGTLEYVTKTEKKYPHLLDAKGQWAVRDDVRYTFVMHNRGNMQLVQNDWLSVRGKAIGPELTLGHVLGEALDEPVLILKACIGNRSLGWDLLPPGSERFTFEGKTYAGYKDDTPSWGEGQEKKPVAWYAGKQYDDDTANAKKVLSELDKYYPGAQKYELAGFVWWQGHKDQNAAHASRYEQNLVNLIKSLRKDFNAPNAPFVLAVGCGNPGRSGFGLQIAEAQLAMNDSKRHPEFAGNVLCVESRDFWKSKEASPNPKQDYHYFRNAETYLEVGNALGLAMVKLLQKTNK